MREDPGTLRSEVEERRCNSGRTHRILARRTHVGPVCEGAEIHRAPGRSRVMGRSIYELLAIVLDDGEVLKRGPP